MTRPTRHFLDRVRERVPGVDADALARDLCRAIDDGRDDVAEFVMFVGSRRDRRVWRFFLADGRRYYAITDPRGALLTVITQRMLRGYKAVRRGDAASWREWDLRRMMEVRG